MALAHSQCLENAYFGNIENGLWVMSFKLLIRYDRAYL